MFMVRRGREQRKGRKEGEKEKGRKRWRGRGRGGICMWLVTKKIPSILNGHLSSLKHSII